MNTTLTIAFLAGLISFLSPCVLPLIPGYISFIAGQELNVLIQKKQRVLFKTILFSLGFSLVFVSFGAAASFVSNIFLYKEEIRIVAGLIIIVFASQLLGFFNIGLLNKTKVHTLKKFSNSLFFPFIIGISFAFGWTPCIGPILGSILAMAAVEKTITEGVLLLCFYSLGLALPFIFSGYAVTRFLGASKKLKRGLRLINIIGGTILLITGILILTNNLQSVGFYLFEYFPILGKLG
tara:strand:+ start:667 stop:1377 length:711 start_codon:yes stop_codon:yes gene_type:complete